MPDPDGSSLPKLPPAPTPTAPPTLPMPSNPAADAQLVTAVFNDAQAMWQKLFGEAGVPYIPAHLQLYSSAVHTGCGLGSAKAGPFYCPIDRTVYLDTSFFDDLQQHFGVGGDFAQAYVVAHEVGHHIQNVLGITHRVAVLDQANPSGANALSVRVELQADCFAGVWAHSTYERSLLEPGDMEEALKAAAAVGDDFIQKASTGTVTPEKWTHGSSAQRQQWLTTGFDSGKPESCDTFSKQP